jgi:anti-sigma factor ChrR (cupin superfamily)
MTHLPTAERLTGQLQPTIGGSTYVDPEQLPWQPSQFDKIQMKVLYRNDAAGEMTVLLKWEPGASLPFYRHPEIEQSWVLEGSFYDHDGICRAGQFVWRTPGSMTRRTATRAA